MLTIRQQFITSRNRPGTRITPTSVTVHNTADPEATAQNERDFLQTHADAKVSFHFAVDDVEVLQCLPLDEMSWHAGSAANISSISIEVCEFDDPERQARANRSAAALVAELLAKFGWGLDRVKAHKCWTGKDCPRLLLPMWDEFLLMIEDEGGRAVFKDVLPSNPYYGAIKAAYEAGLVAGYPDGTLGAKEQITTERMVALLHRLYIKVRSDVMTAADAQVQALIAKCKPATVMITSTKRSAVPSLGTGFIIRGDGYIATNEHVVKDKDGEFTSLEAWVMTDGAGFEQAKAYPAKVVATNNWDDVALLKIEASGLTVLPVTTREPLEGETVVAIGNPRGYQYVSSKGIVTQDTALLGGMIDGRFQTDAAINAGNSGGPVISMAGEVLGVAEASVLDSDNLSFAVKSQRLKDLVDKHLPGLIK